MTYLTIIIANDPLRMTKNFKVDILASEFQVSE